MPKKTKRPCRYSGCANLTDDSSGYCGEHKAVAARHYDKYLRWYDHNKRYGWQWRKVRALFLTANPFCEMCKQSGKLVDATEVHHIKPISEGGSLTDPNNLMALCKSCHSRITMTAENRIGR